MPERNDIPNEHWPMRFRDARRAVAWADRFLLQPRVKSQLGQIVRQSIERKELSAMDKNGEMITIRRLQDLAETISVCLSGVKNPPGSFYRHVYGKCTHTFGTADQLAHLVWDGPGPRKTRTIAKMRVLAALLIEDCRQREQAGNGISAVDIAKQMRIERKCYYDNWLRYASAMREILLQWIDRVEREMTEELSGRGIV